MIYYPCSGKLFACQASSFFWRIFSKRAKWAIMSSDKKNSGKSYADKGQTVFLSWFYCVLGWLLCAALCLVLTVELENWPQAYDMFFPAILLILFCNVLVFLFIASRFGNRSKALLGAICRVCLGEGLLLGGFYLLGRFAMGA